VPAIFSQQRVFASATPPPSPPPPPPPPPPPAAPGLTVSAGASSGTAGGGTVSGPTLTAPGGNLSSVNWSASASPSGLTISPSSGTLTPGQSVTPTLSSITAAIYAITVANNSGGTITGSAGNVQFYAPVPPPPPAPAPSGGVMQLTLTSATSGTLPFAAGYTFRQGDIPAGQGVVVSGATAQATIKSTWPDGSARIAVIAGTYTSAGSPVTLTMSAGTASTGTVLTTSDLDAALAGNNVIVDAGGLGLASWSAGADWASPFATWVSGHRMSSWIYRKPVGSDTHLVAWLEVRLYAGGAVEILPWIENGYLNVASPTNKSATYTFSMGGTTRFSGVIDLKHHQRTPLISGTGLSHWLGTDPGVTMRHDVAYLMSTEMVPTYRALTPAGASVVSSVCPTTFAPLQQGGYTYQSDSMSSGGAAGPIGLLPTHDVLYLTCAAADAARVYKAVVFNGYSAGRYRHHYRDETTNRPPLTSAYPTLWIDNNTPTPSGGEGPERDIAHHPSVGFMAYLVTGRWYFMEEAALSASFNHFVKSFNSVMRDGSKGLFQSCFGAWQTRSAAWTMRTWAQALAIIPDADTTLKADYLQVWHENVDKFHAQYVVQPGNPWGWVEPGEEYDATFRLGHGAPWQQDFVSAAVGYSRALDLTTDATRKARWQAFHEWKAQSTIKRLGPSDAFWYINGGVYGQRISPSALTADDYRNGTGTFYTPAQSYAQIVAGLTAASAPTGWIGTTEGVLNGEIMPGESAMWGNLTPSLAYAVRFGISGALAAYQRLVGAGNWIPLAAAFNAQPVWSVLPASGALPTWLASQPLNTWIEIPNTNGRVTTAVVNGVSEPVLTTGDGAFEAWGAFTVKGDTSELFIAASGGHGDSSDNRVVSISLSSDTPTWVLRSQPSTVVQLDRTSGYYLDGKPTSRHLYDDIFYLPQLQRVMMVGGRAIYGGGGPETPAVTGFDVNSNTWDTEGKFTSVVQSGGTPFGMVMNKRTGAVFTTILGAVSGRWSPPVSTTGTGLGTFTSNAVTGFSAVNNRWPGAWDGSRSQCFVLNLGNGEGGNVDFGLRAYRWSDTGGVANTITFNTSATYTAWVASVPEYAAMDYDPDNDCYLFMHKKQAPAIQRIKPNSGTVWDMDTLTVAGGPPTARPSGNYGPQGSFKYVPALRGFAYLPRANSNIWFIRTA